MIWNKLVGGNVKIMYNFSCVSVEQKPNYRLPKMLTLVWYVKQRTRKNTRLRVVRSASMEVKLTGSIWTHVEWRSGIGSGNWSNACAIRGSAPRKYGWERYKGTCSPLGRHGLRQSKPLGGQPKPDLQNIRSRHSTAGSFGSGGTPEKARS